MFSKGFSVGIIKIQIVDRVKSYYTNIALSVSWYTQQVTFVDIDLLISISSLH